jgi:site-specific DNA recombinase
LASRATRYADDKTLGSGRPLLGIIVHEDGSRFSPTHATKKGRRYPYYVSRQSGVSAAGSVRRLPAVETEQAVVSTLRHFLNDAPCLAKLFPELRVQQARLLVSAARHKAELLNDVTSKEAPRLICDLVSSVVVSESGLSLSLSLAKLSQELLPEVPRTGEDHDDFLTLPCPLVIKRRGSEVRLVIADDRYDPKAIPSLERVVARARDLAERISNGELYTMGQLVAYSGNTKQYVRRILRLAALSPRNIDKILNGTQPMDLTVAALCDGVSPLWDEQTIQAAVRTTDKCQGEALAPLR